MRREKRFKTIALRTLFFHFFSGILAVWAAFSGWGIYALLVSPIISSIGVFCVNYYNYPQRISFRIKKESVLTISSFSIYQFLFSFCNYFSRNLDKLIVGKCFSMTELGYYDKSYHLMMVPIHYVSSVIEPVLHPVLASFQDNLNEIKNKNIKLSRLISYISFPIGLILYFCGGEIIRIMYGSRWDAAVPVFKILALSLPLQVIFSTVAPIYQAAGKTKVMFWAGILNTFVTITGFIIATYVFGTLEAVAWSWDISLLINFINSYYVLHHFALKVSPIGFYKALIPQIMNSFFVFVIIYNIINYIHLSNIFILLAIKSVIVLIMTSIFANLFKQYNSIVVCRKMLNTCLSKVIRSR
jgi:PST family polysaccharide transporter